MSARVLRTIVFGLGLTLSAGSADAVRPKVRKQGRNLKTLKTKAKDKQSRQGNQGKKHTEAKVALALKSSKQRLKSESKLKKQKLEKKKTERSDKQQGNQKQLKQSKQSKFSLRSEVREFQKYNRSLTLKNQGADAHISKVMRHSEKNGNYYSVSDMHWGKGVGPNKQFRAQEDFRQGKTFVKFVEHIAGQKRSSLVIGGDWLEFMEHVNHDAPISEVKKTLTQILEGHRAETAAIGQAVAKRGLRLIYIAGNHDVHLVNPEVRAHLSKEIKRISGLKGEEAARFDQRVGYSGHAVVLGKFGEGLVHHGHVQDPTNNWRSVANPYNAKREIQTNLGWNIVANVFRAIEKRNPSIDNTPLSSTTAVAKKVLTNPRNWGNALKTVWMTLAQRESLGKSGELSQRLDDRVVLRSWARRTGFAEKMATPIPGAKKLISNESKVTQKLESIYAAQPTPVHESMKSKWRLVNLISSLVRMPKQAKESKKAEPKLIKELTSSFTNLRYVMWGHSHYEIEWHGNSQKGELGHANTGTWTKAAEWQNNVVHHSTDAKGRLTMHGLKRTSESGIPNLPAKIKSL